MHAILRGTDHTELDRVATATPAPDLAVALTRGRHVKRYGYTDPNEDVVAAVRDDSGATALVVADGHNGHPSSHAAVDSLVARVQDKIPTWDRREAVLAFHEVNTDIEAVRRTMAPPRNQSRTTLVTAVVAEDVDGQRFLTYASVGDSAVFVVRGATVHRVGRDRHYFLGARLSAPQIAGAMDYDQVDLTDSDVVIVVSDGYTNFADPDMLAGAVSDDPTQTALRVIDVAGEAGAGDNVAVAVLYPPPSSMRTV